MGQSVWIVIVNYRTSNLVADCLHSIAAQIGQLPGCHTVVVDNASGDGSIEKLTTLIDDKGWRDWASLIPSDRNGGFAFGSNLGIRTALASDRGVEYVMLLNPDTVVRAGAIRALFEFMRSHPQVGIAGSLLENTDGGFEASAHNAFTLLGELDAGARLGVLSRVLSRYVVTPPVRPVAHECEWVSGASLIVRCEVFDTVGLLDEGYFLYFEEADFCLRARRAGWRVWFVPESRVLHFEGASTGIRDIVRRRLPYWYDSRRRYFVKHFGIRGLILADLLWAVGRMSFAMRTGLRLRSDAHAPDPKWFAFDLLWGDVRSLCSGKLSQASRTRDII